MRDPLIATAGGSVSRRRSARAGQALVEFAVIAPVFMLLLTGLFEFSRHFYSRLSVRHSVVGPPASVPPDERSRTPRPATP
jgi:hypothetical protein